MDFERVRDTWVRVLEDIQRDSGYETGGITEDIRPLDDLEEFDSLMIPVATCILEDALGVRIPDKVNIFVAEGEKRTLTVREAAEVVCKSALVREGSRVG